MTTSPTTDLRFGGYITAVPSVAVLRASVDPSQFQRGDSIIVSGNSDISDGRGAIYAWLPESVRNDDDYLVIAPLTLNSAPGRWVLSIGPTPELAGIVEEVAGLLATVANEQAARTSADGSAMAAITTEQSARVTADQAIATKTTTLEAHFTSQQAAIGGLTTSLATTNAHITDEQTARATAIEALTTRTTTLEADYTAQQTTIGGLTTTLATTAATITNEATTRANADGALASQISTLQASTTSAQATLSARITDESTARTTADQSSASKISTLEATTGTLTAQVTTTQSAISVLNGKTAASWTVESVAGNNRAQLSIHADANDGAGVDIVGDVSIAGNLLVSGTVSTSKLEDGSVSNGDFVASSSIFAAGGGVSATPTYYAVDDGNWQTILSSGYTITDTARMDVVANYKQAHATGSPDWACRLLIDGVVVDDGWGQAPCDKVGMLGSKSVEAGYRTVVMQWQANAAVTAVRPKFKVNWSFK